MPKASRRAFFSLMVSLLSVASLATVAVAQQTPVFTPGNLVVSVEGCGVNAGTCTNVPNGTGNGVGNSSNTGYGDNQAAPLTLFQYAPTGVSSASFVNSLVLPQSGSVANSIVSGEYGSSSEGTVQLSGNSLYLTIMGYGVNATTFNANPTSFGIPGGELAQSGSLTGQSYTPVPRVVALIDPYGNVNSSTLLYNIFNTNNPRSAYTLTGTGNVYVSGQGSGCDLTGGVFLTTIGLTNNAPTAITGGDALPTSTCVGSGYTGSTVAQDTRTVQIFGNTLYISVDSTSGKSNNRSYLGTLGTPPATSMYVPAMGTFPSGYTDGPSQISGIGNAGGTGKETLTAATANGVNSSGQQVNISPENYFFASPSVLYIADSGSPKQSSATSLLGAGGLQKWVNSQSNGSGTWTWEYTLYKGLNLVANSAAVPANTSGTTGLLGLTGTVVGGTAYLYATNYTIADLDPTYLYGISDVVSATANPGTTFTKLATAPQDSNFKGVSLAPSLPAGSATITSSPSGLAVTTSGTGCVPGTYITPVTLIWTPGSSCELSVATPQAGGSGTEYNFVQWQDGTTATSDFVTAPSTSAIYTLSFSTAYQLTTSATTGGSVSAGGYFASGSNATITATPASGYYFVNFTGSTTSTSNPLTVAMNGPQSITANFAQQVAAVLTSPASGSVLSSSSPTTFTWSGTGITDYVLRLGTTVPGSNDLYDSNVTTAQSATAGPFPANGQLVFASLYSLVGNSWQEVNYIFIESGSPSPAVLTAPVGGSTLSGTSATTFTWSAGMGATSYILRLGTAGPGANDLYDSGATTALTESVGPLPSSGLTVYATLYSLIGGVWQPESYTFTESGTPAPAALTAPTAGSTLSGTSATTFTWTAGSGAAGYVLRLGIDGPGASDLYDSGETAALTATAGPFPTNGVTIYAALYSLIGGAWQEADYTFIESGTPTPGSLTAPTAGSTLSSTAATTFTWAAGVGTSDYVLRLGTAGPGANDLYDSGVTTALTVSAGPFPANGVTIYGTLYSLIAGVWQPESYTFTESGTATPAALTSPATGSTLSGTVATTFTWTAGVGATNYVLRLGTTGPGSNDLYDSGETSALNATAGPFPTNGVTINATLYSLIAGAWQEADYTYVESGP